MTTSESDAEAARVDAEHGRTVAEKSRVDAETMRVDAVAEAARAFADAAEAARETTKELRMIRRDRLLVRLALILAVVGGFVAVSAGLYAAVEAHASARTSSRIATIQTENHRLLVEVDHVLSAAGQAASQSAQTAVLKALEHCQFLNDRAVLHNLPESPGC